jgi:IS605 OrfB family transposase
MTETIKRTIPILIEHDNDLKATLHAFQQVCNDLSPICWNGGKPFSARSLQKHAYHQVKGIVSAQMTCTAIRLVAACYSKRKRKKLSGTVNFKKPFAVFLIGKRKRDAAIKRDGTIRIWTVGGRKRLAFSVPEHFLGYFFNAISFDSLTVKERNGQLIGYLCVTLKKPAVKGSVLVGVDRNETNLLVAVKETSEVFFESGLKLRIWRKKHRKKVARLQKKLAERKAQRKDTRSVRRLLKRLSLRQRNFTKTYCQTVAKRLVVWAGTDAVLALENLKFQQGKKGSEAINRRLHQFPHGLLLRCIRNKGEMLGIPVLLVNPAFTSQTCSRCGNLGDRQRHRFCCPHCGFTLHADLNAAFNILRRAEETMLSEPKGLGSGLKSTSPEAQTVKAVMGKPSALADGS